MVALSKRTQLAKDEGVRSIENPILALFDLASEVNDQIPQVRKVLLIALAFMAVWLVIFFILIIALLAVGQPVLMVGAMLLFAISMYATYFLYHTREFLGYFGNRHTMIIAARDADAIVHIPRGKDSVGKFMTYLKAQSSFFAQFCQQNPHFVHHPVLLTGASGVTYHFDAHVFRPSATTFRWFGTGDPGYSLFIRAFEHTPSLQDLHAVKLGVRDVAQKSRILPNRVVVIVETPGEVSLPDDVYQELTKQQFEVLVGGRRGLAAFQVVTQDSDGTYDFVPVVMQQKDGMP